MYLGTGGPLSMRPLEALLAADQAPCAVLVARMPGERKRKPGLERLRPANAGDLQLSGLASEPGLVRLAWEHGLPVYEVGRLSHPENLAELRALEADVLAVSCFPEVVSAQVLGAARLGGLNVHPSRLPRYRGPAPLFWIFQEGRGEAGVTVHAMEPAADTGAVHAQEYFPLTSGVRGTELEERCGQLGGRLLVEALDALAAGRARPVPQDEASRSWFGPPRPSDYRVEFDWLVRRAFDFLRGVANDARPVEIFTDRGSVWATDALAWWSEGGTEPPDKPPGRAIELRQGTLWVRAE